LAKNAEDVKAWSIQQVIDNFLIPIELGHLSQFFHEHKVTGSVLVALTKTDLMFMGYPADRRVKNNDRSQIAIGDRVYLDNILEIVRRGVMFMDMDKIVWKVFFPMGSFQYYDSCMQFIQYKCCGACMERNMAELTPRGLTIRRRPPKKLFGCCVEFNDDYMDMRMLKDVDHKVEYKCCCNGCPRNEMRMTFLLDTAPIPIMVAHPLLDNRMADDVKSMWAELRLVGDN